MEYNEALKKEGFFHTLIRKNLQDILLDERRQSEEVCQNLIPTLLAGIDNPMSTCQMRIN